VLRQGYTALLVASFGNLFAGLALASMRHRLGELPGLIVLIPAAIGMRGNIFGALGSRLGTGIHAGVFAPGMRRGTFLQQNVASAFVLTLSTSLFLGVAARLISGGLGGPSISTWDYLVISVIGGVLGSVVVGTATVLLARAANRREWDMDAVSAPLVTAIGDMVTLPALWAASYVADLPTVTPIVGVILSVGALWATIRGLATDAPLSRRIIRESILVLALAGIVDIVAGTVVDARLNHFLTFPVLLVLLPPFLADAGALGGILSSRLSSKLHLGVLSPTAVPEPLAFLDASINFLLATSLFLLLGLSAWLVGQVAHLESPSAPTMMAVSLLAGFLATLVSSAVAYYAATASFRFGFDPDNHGIPIVTSSMDLAGTLCLVVAIAVLGLERGRLTAPGQRTGTGPTPREPRLRDRIGRRWNVSSTPLRRAGDSRSSRSFPAFRSPIGCASPRTSRRWTWTPSFASRVGNSAGRRRCRTTICTCTSRWKTMTVLPR